MKSYKNTPQTTDVNVSKSQPSKASGLEGISFQRSTCAPILYTLIRFSFILTETLTKTIFKKPKKYWIEGC